MKLLFVNCCISRRGAGSRTHALAEAFLTAFRAAHPDAAVEEITQETLLALKPFDAALLQKRDALAEAGNFDARCMRWPGSSGRRTPLWWRRRSGTSAIRRPCGRISSIFPPLG